MGTDENGQVQEFGKKEMVKNVAKPFLFLAVLWVAYCACSGFGNASQGLAYFIILIVNTVIISLLMKPDLLNERAHVKENVKKGDIIYALMVGRIGPLLMIVVCGLDTRFGWTAQYSQAITLSAFAIMIAGLLFSDWAVIANRYFSGVVRIQRERGHEVIDTGPYRYVRHPGYLGSIVYNIATPLILNSLSGFIPVALLVGATIVRTKKEDGYLKIELRGYKEYAEKTKYRLIPFIC